MLHNATGYATPYKSNTDAPSHNNIPDTASPAYPKPTQGSNDIESGKAMQGIE